MKIPVFAALTMSAGLLHAQEPVDGTRLLDKVISAPGSYGQTCDAMSSPSDLPYRAFAISDLGGAWLSKGNKALVESNRAAVVKAIRARLLALDFSRKAVQPKEDKKPEESEEEGGYNFGTDPQSLNPLLLDIIEELDAIETLPELLVVEAKLVDGIAKAKDSTKAPVPVVTGWSVHDEGDKSEDFESPKHDRRNNLFQARVAQRDLVILMANMMRKRSYAPYLSSKLEAAYAKGIKARVKTDGLTSYKPGEPLPKELEGMDIVMDPIVHVPMVEHQTVSIPYSRESRDEIRAAAEKWIAEHP